MSDVVRIYVSFLFSLLDTLFLVHWSCDHLVIANIVFILDIYIFDDVIITFSPISPCVVSFSLYTHVSYYVCNLIFQFHTKMP